MAENFFSSETLKEENFSIGHEIHSIIFLNSTFVYVSQGTLTDLIKIQKLDLAKVEAVNICEKAFKEHRTRGGGAGYTGYTAAHPNFGGPELIHIGKKRSFHFLFSGCILRS